MNKFNIPKIVFDRNSREAVMSEINFTRDIIVTNLDYIQNTGFISAVEKMHLNVMAGTLIFLMQKYVEDKDGRRNNQAR